MVNILNTFLDALQSRRKVFPFQLKKGTETQFPKSEVAEVVYVDL